MENAINGNSNVEKIGPDGLQVSSSSGSLAGNAQRLFCPEKSAGCLAGGAVTLQTTGTASGQTCLLLLTYPHPGQMVQVSAEYTLFSPFAF